ncbi:MULTISPECIES: lipoyl(octanoyl) transferase LipB [Pantoea]|uniref:Octanoyltransferase n=2 Tax=Pantoea brenneri TaxID=472694 RepID=A0A7Y6NBX7_9GAMM|nr:MULTISPECIES: lipoyl(octanoyl) transferase LipB [Pantoea]KKD34018.1 lipoate--protein ligase [Pantoea sp. 3.5.1]MBS6032497.1 lipoyl(octanoyl) transferase LipB [Pantoea sp.]MBZ6393778.1 lipoyl(octanoyl) transferase LipB [Pantoea sp.]MBZ6436844.1 lipoyl(octanoyl) transferase LipB [Pantoea sp.]MCQ5472432.1 lipoyl(octanoyl) transferase LipB [Pantoea brenneri]
MSVDTLLVRRSGLRDWQSVSDAMHHYTDQRDSLSRDEIWLVEHPPVFTQGQAGKAEHLLMPGDIPVVQSDRGGQVTYHGPGQQVMYVLIDIKRRKIGVRQLVTALEETVITTLAGFGVSARARPDAPGVYVGEQKICSLGLRIRKGCSFHGLALNVAMDLAPFSRINPCGYAGMSMTQLQHFQPDVRLDQVQAPLVTAFARLTGYENVEWSDEDLPIQP